MTPKISAYPENTTFPELYHPAVSVCLHLNIDVHTQNINEKTGMPLNSMKLPRYFYSHADTKSR